MVQRIVIEAEPPGGDQSMFRLSIDANLIAKGVTVAQAYYLVGEVPGDLGSRNTLSRWRSIRTAFRDWKAVSRRLPSEVPSTMPGARVCRRARLCQSRSL